MFGEVSNVSLFYTPTFSVELGSGVVRADKAGEAFTSDR